MLHSAYDADRATILEALQGFLEAREIAVEGPDVVRRAVNQAVHGADFADALITASAVEAGCSTTVTFDTRAVRSTGMTLLE